MAMRGWTLDQVAAAAAPVVEPLVRAGRPLDRAIADACSELQVVASSLPEAQALEVAEQLAPQVLEEVGGREFTPRPVLADPATRQAEDDLVSDERGSVLVLNPASNMLHRAGLTTLGLPEEEATAMCGWRFGRALGTTFPDVADAPPGYQSLCGKCLPWWRALRKRTEVPRGERQV